MIPAKEEYCIDIREKDELVGAYCRVSTMSDDQVESYDLQRQEYEDKIAQNKHWTLVDVYADEGDLGYFHEETQRLQPANWGL